MKSVRSSRRHGKWRSKFVFEMRQLKDCSQEEMFTYNLSPGQKVKLHCIDHHFRNKISNFRKARFKLEVLSLAQSLQGDYRYPGRQRFPSFSALYLIDSKYVKCEIRQTSCSLSCRQRRHIEFLLAHCWSKGLSLARSRWSAVPKLCRKLERVFQL